MKNYFNFEKEGLRLLSEKVFRGFEKFSKRVFKTKMASQSSGNGFSNKKWLHRVRETNFQAKNDFPEFGKCREKLIGIRNTSKRSSYASYNYFLQYHIFFGKKSCRKARNAVLLHPFWGRTWHTSLILNSFPRQPQLTLRLSAKACKNVAPFCSSIKELLILN